MVPRHVVNEARARKKSLKAGSGEKNVPRRREIATRRPQGAVTPDQLDSQHATAGMGLHEVDSLLQRIGGYESVGVEQQYIASANQRQRLIVGTPESHVGRIFNQLNIGISR